MKFSALPSQHQLRSKLDYDPRTGLLRWRIDKASTCPAGTVAGAITHKGYVRLKFDGRAYLAHRVIWKWVTGDEPPHQIDHIDLNKANNAWLNLRPATNSQNHMNRAAIGGHGLPKGITFNKRQQKYIARIKKDGIRFQLGCFDDIASATKAYRDAAAIMFGVFARAA